MRKVFKLMTMLLCAVFITSMWSCNTRENSSTPTSPTSPTSSSNTITSTPSVVGTYSCTDAMGDRFEIIINPDYTVKMTDKDWNNVTYYGTYRSGEITMSDYVTFVWPNGSKILKYPTLKDGYLYDSKTAEDAKNPNLRVAVKKIK